MDLDSGFPLEARWTSRPHAEQWAAKRGASCSGAALLSKKKADVVSEEDVVKAETSWGRPSVLRVLP